MQLGTCEKKLKTNEPTYYTYIIYLLIIIINVLVAMTQFIELFINSTIQ